MQKLNTAQAQECATEWHPSIIDTGGRQLILSETFTDIMESGRAALRYADQHGIAWHSYGSVMSRASRQR